MPLSPSDLTGVFPAMVTPFTADGTIDRPAVKTLVEHLLAGGASGLVPIGGTGEYTALTPAERKEMVAVTVEAAAGRVPVVAGVLSPGYGEAKLAGDDMKAAGADAVMLLTPFYALGTQEGVRRYFQAFRSDVDLPIVFYEIPARTNISAKADTLQAIVEDGSIIGMKYSNYDLVEFIKVMDRVGDKVAVMSGEEPLFATHLSLGATGGVLATSNIYPRIWTHIFELAKAGNLTEAVAMQNRLEPLFAAIFGEANPGPLKRAMKMAGLDAGEVRLPLLPPSAETIDKLEAIMPMLDDLEAAPLAKAG